MKKTIKKMAAVGLTLTSVMSLAACGNSAADSGTTTAAAAKEVTKPDSFTVMVNGTVVTEANGGKEFYEYLKSVDGGINITWIRPDHSGYYDAVANAFNAKDSMPDVVLLSSDTYAMYASGGYLWDMTDAWNNSETKNSGRLKSNAQKVMDSMMVNGLDGKPAMYGMAPASGGGCCTYVKETWVNAIGMTKADVENKTLTFDEYYAMLKKMHEVKNSVVISAAGFIGTEAPYTNYLPEFYQQAHYTFYKDASGKYVDGFSEKAMEDALARIQTGVADGVIDKETVNNSTANARDKFYADTTGVFSYWSGTWANTLKTNLENKKLDGSLIALNPVKELGSYIERAAAPWCITTHASNPEGIFKYFIDKMLDGGDVQTAWVYGAKGTHWDTKAETVTLQGKEDKATTWKEGEFHGLPSPEKPNSLMTKNHIDPLACLAEFTNGDPGKDIIIPLAKSNNDWFVQHSTIEQTVPVTEQLSDNISDINKTRNVVINDVAVGKYSAADGIKQYKAQVGDKVEKVLASLNK